MPDKTYTAADFAREDSARHPDGRTADRRYPLPGKQWCAWASRPDGSYHALTDAEMADGGWSPVRECPDPERHDNPRPVEVTDEMAQRAMSAYFQYTKGSLEDFKRAIIAALTVPTRPEGAEDIEVALRDEWTFEDDNEFTDLANRLASRGVRVEGSGR